jgi:hypothetical protein
VLLGGFLVSPKISASLLSFDLPGLHTAIDTPAESAILIIATVYLIAALFNLRIPDTGARYPKQETNPLRLFADFAHCCAVLWKDKLGQISLAVTTLFWGAGATLQFIVLKWAEKALGLGLSQGAYLQAIVAIGIAGGAIAAAARIPLRQSLSVLRFGVAMGVVVLVLAAYHREFIPDIRVLGLPLYLLLASILLITVGAMAGYFVVPMNALLQHRGHVLMSAGHSIAVQNFNENLGILVMLLFYASLIWLDAPVQLVIVFFGLFVAGSMFLVIKKHRTNQQAFDSVALIPDGKH